MPGSCAHLAGRLRLWGRDSTDVHHRLRLCSTGLDVIQRTLLTHFGTLLTRIRVIQRTLLTNLIA